MRGLRVGMVQNNVVGATGIVAARRKWPCNCVLVSACGFWRRWTKRSESVGEPVAKNRNVQLMQGSSKYCRPAWRMIAGEKWR